MTAILVTGMSGVGKSTVLGKRGYQVVDTDDGERIVADTVEVEPLLRASATVEIDTRGPVAGVVERLTLLAGAPPASRT